MTRAKVCGVMTVACARAVRAAGADYLGAILSPGYGRSLSPADAARVYRAGSTKRVGVFVDPEVSDVVAMARELGLDVIQLGGRESPDDVEAVRVAGPWTVWKTVHAGGEFSVAKLAARYARVADGVHVDAWDPRQPGGTGRTFAWAGVGSEVRRATSGRALFIASGGMSAQNAPSAVARLAPDVLDVSSGVETRPGAKDPESVRAFVQAVHGAGHPTG